MTTAGQVHELSATIDQFPSTISDKRDFRRGFPTPLLSCGGTAEDVGRTTLYRALLIPRSREAGVEIESGWDGRGGRKRRRNGEGESQKNDSESAEHGAGFHPFNRSVLSRPNLLLSNETFQTRRREIIFFYSLFPPSSRLPVRFRRAMQHLFLPLKTLYLRV